MRRMPRWALNGAAAVSALLFVVSCVLWARSGRVFDQVEWGDGYFVTSLHGIIGVGRQQPSGSSGDGSRLRWQTSPAEHAWLNWPGFALKIAEPVWAGIRVSVLQLPHWLYLLLFLAAPLLWLARLRHNQRGSRRGASEPGQTLCPACGYDLRATPGRCPECGHVPRVDGWTEGASAGNEKRGK